LEYPGNILAHIHVSWLDPKKIRQVTVVGDKKMLSSDDLSSSGPVEIFSKRIERTPFYKDYGEFHLLARDGEAMIPDVRNEEPVVNEAAHFWEWVTSGRRPVADGGGGMEVVRTLEEINALLRASSGAYRV